MSPYNCIVVLGPTASGKTRLACQLAAELKGEVLSFDSRQIYKELNLGAGKDLEEYCVNGKQIPYHLVDIAEVSQKFYLHDFVRELARAFSETFTRGHLPIICGGTGLYLDALRKDYAYTQVPEDLEKRKERAKLPKEELLLLLDAFPAEVSSHVDRQSLKRILRGLEVAEYLSRHTVSRQDPGAIYKPFYLGLRLPGEQLHERIFIRLQERLKQGLVEEAERLVANGISHERLQELGLEYKYLSLYLQNKITEAELLEQLYTAICRYAKRQMTWFRKMEKEGVNIQWLEAPVCNTDLILQLKAQLLF